MTAGQSASERSASERSANERSANERSANERSARERLVGAGTRETPNYEVDLTSCDREPIHALGAVQSFGVLLAVTTDWIVARVSANAEAFLGRAPGTLPGESLRGVLPDETIHAIRGAMHGL